MLLKKSVLFVALIVALHECHSASTAIRTFGRNDTRTIKHLKYRDFDSNFYFVSEMSTNYNSALRDCKAFMGEEAGLLAIESQEEWNFVKLLLEDYGTAVHYWTDGQYNAGASPYRFSWSNGKPLGDWSPWGVNQPPSVGFAYQRVSIYHTSRFESDWRVRTNTELNRYICEYPNPTIAIPCQSTNDLLILIDNSGSISQADFQTAKNFVANLALAWSDSLLNRIGMISFDYSASTVFGLTTPTDPQQLQKQILDFPYVGGSTMTNLAIDLAIQLYAQEGRSVPRNVVVLTDGGSNYKELTADAASRAQNAGLRMFSVGIGQNLDANELKVIAGGNELRVFTVANFNDLILLLRPVSLRVCPDSSD